MRNNLGTAVEIQSTLKHPAIPGSLLGLYLKSSFFILIGFLLQQKCTIVPSKDPDTHASSKSVLLRETRSRITSVPGLEDREA